MEREVWLGIAAAFIAVFREVISKIIWSLILYLLRGEFNSDNNETTVDEFLWLNSYTGLFTECRIIEYKMTGVRWGFAVGKGFTLKKSTWFEWAGFRKDRFPRPIEMGTYSLDEIANLLKRK